MRENRSKMMSKLPHVKPVRKVCVRPFAPQHEVCPRAAVADARRDETAVVAAGPTDRGQLGQEVFAVAEHRLLDGRAVGLDRATKKTS